MSVAYPDSADARDRWILSRRPARRALDSMRPHAFLLEEERAESGEVLPVATVFLTNRECPWRCLMCDLWKNTLTESVPPGAIAAQIDYALNALEKNRRPDFQRGGSAGMLSAVPELAAGNRLDRQAGVRAPRQIKLYNSGSFFDPRAIPPDDYPAIAARVRGFERVIVECHPALVGQRVLRFRDLLSGRLEVALGLETVHPAVLPRLNKRMTLEQFSRAAGFLKEHAVALRVFLLVKPPFLDEAEALEWAKHSLDFAFDCGATVASLIPTRFGNGALEALAESGAFSAPRLVTLEEALGYGVHLRRGR
ncbi:MAG TPA: hypothetical protein VEO53_04635, partial [Candidatus Binatia bacterium]|nr:hypothetical protein [Candidatus Binatia bacterium]